MRYLGILIAILIIGGGIYWYSQSETQLSSPGGEPTGDVTDNTGDPNATSTPDGDTNGSDKPYDVIGTSAGGNEIHAYHFGDGLPAAQGTAQAGEEELLFVGGIHGGYDWNTTLVAYNLIDHLQANPDIIPENTTLTIIPALNPDGLESTIGTTTRFTQNDVPSLSQTVPGRYNANSVDLNRNFACNWQETGYWRDEVVDTGASAFSEPETAALRDYVQANNPSAAVMWYSASGDVVAAKCNGSIDSEARDMMNTYASASGYNTKDTYDYYTLTGDGANWLAKVGVPTISVVLESHDRVEWEENRAGIEALLEEFAQ